MKFCPIRNEECIGSECAGYYEQDAHTLAHIDQFCRFMKGDHCFGTRFPETDFEREWLKRRRESREERYQSSLGKVKNK